MEPVLSKKYEWFSGLKSFLASSHHLAMLPSPAFGRFNDGLHG